MNTRNEKSSKNEVELPSARFEVCSIGNFIKFGSSLNFGKGKRICMGKSCWMARLALGRYLMGPGPAKGLSNAEHKVNETVHSLQPLSVTCLYLNKAGCKCINK